MVPREVSLTIKAKKDTDAVKEAHRDSTVQHMLLRL